MSGNTPGNTEVVAIGSTQGRGLVLAADAIERKSYRSHIWGHKKLQGDASTNVRD